ncbi:hypothetical protein POTOM_026119 [Populus tomentosa]|uniref:Acyl carrier protein n=1 Tax=Populus tomentosa TaxID=118781 RepID=A0A8X8CXZ5_POPTO|nr:hypothetical protein POTOM_026119 [Populus tomentosa]
MASFLAAPACPLVALPTTTRASFSTVQQKSFSVNVSDTPISNYVTKAYEVKCLNDKAQPETLETVQSTIAKQLSVEVSTVTPETKFADLGADSLDTVEIMMALEEQFGVSIGGGAENIAPVQDAADLIEKVKAAA